MKVGIYTPYLNSFGGGERYMLTIAETFSQDHSVDLLLDQHHLDLDPQNLISRLSERLNLNLADVNLRVAPMGGGLDFIKRLFLWKDYDLLFYLTDGSIFYSTAKKSIIHFQVPFQNTTAKTFWGRKKLSSWNLAICNSQFTEDVIQKEWPIKTQVVYPPVAIESIKPLKKKHRVLSVGRFASFSKSKKHEVMIEAFKQLYQAKKISDWELFLAGSVEGDESYVKELKKLAKGLPVTFCPNLSFTELIKLYGESGIYWHAAGFKEEDPAKMEHFGIATVEAMAGGCVPIVINKGGQPEIVEDQKSGFLWNTLSELQLLTLQLIKDPQLRLQISKQAISRSQVFSKASFKQQISSLLHE